jgi:elongation factor 1-gamma
MKQFWEIYDPEGWSLWICRYKYNEENKKVFMTSNLVSPVYNRYHDHYLQSHRADA